MNAPSRRVRKIRKNKKGNLLMAVFTGVIQFDGEAFLKIPRTVGIGNVDEFDA